MNLQSNMWMWHVSRQRWQFQLLCSLLSLMDSQQETLPVKYMIFTSRPQTWLRALRHATAGFGRQCKKLEQRLFLFSWHEETSPFLEACDDLAIYIAALPSLMKRRSKIDERPKLSIDSRMLLIVDELPGIEKMALKGKHWERQLQLAYYRQELIRFHGVKMLKNIARRTNTLIILVTRQLPQLEHEIWEIVRDQSPVTIDLTGTRSSLIPRWALDFENWFFVMGAEPRSLNPKDLLVTFLSPRRSPSLSITARRARFFSWDARIYDGGSRNVFVRIATYWWAATVRDSS